MYKIQLLIIVEDLEGNPLETTEYESNYSFEAGIERVFRAGYNIQAAKMVSVLTVAIDPNTQIEVSTVEEPAIEEEEAIVADMSFEEEALPEVEEE